MGAKYCAIRPSGSVYACGIDDESDCERAQGVGKRGQTSEHASQRKRSNLANVRDGDGCKRTYYETIQELAAEEELRGCCDKFHGDGHEGYHKTEDNDHAATKPICKLTAPEGTDDCTTTGQFKPPDRTLRGTYEATGAP